MTFQEIQNEVMDRLRLTSGKDFARVGRAINIRYRRICSSVGLQTSVRGEATATATIGNRSLVFTGVEKIYALRNPALTAPMGVLDELTFDELRNLPEGVDPADRYAIQLMGATSVTVYLGSTPSTAYPLIADAEVVLTNLRGTDVPAFPEDYHDALMYGALADVGPSGDRADYEQDYEGRMGELRLFIAKSAYLTIYQGKTSPVAAPSILMIG